MPRPIKCTRLFSDESGESHFEDTEVDMSSIQYAPPAPALDISQPTGATHFFWFRFPKDWQDAAHPSPRRQLFVVLEGVVEGWTSTGDTRTFKAGDRLLMEDLTGKGHGARPLDGEALAVVIALA
ncbi:hypothetical protein [Sulfitobacter sp.]|uniref:hypothetical protein n=1 Tax=Sulfitobacter sp. TaxID=1903071 RepID=UPI0030038189